MFLFILLFSDRLSYILGWSSTLSIAREDLRLLRFPLPPPQWQDYRCDRYQAYFHLVLEPEPRASGRLGKLYRRLGRLYRRLGRLCRLTLISSCFCIYPGVFSGPSGLLGYVPDRYNRVLPTAGTDSFSHSNSLGCPLYFICPPYGPTSLLEGISWGWDGNRLAIVEFQF